MTLETAKRLYAHFVEKGMKAEAADIAKQRPQVLVVEKPKEEPKPVVKETKSKKVK